jgi:cysteine synthase A
VAGAVALAKALGPGSRVATILCDTGFRYLSSLYNPAWLKAKGPGVPGLSNKRNRL